MTLLRLACIVLLILALICALVPTAIAEAGWEVWFIAGMLCWALDSVWPSVVVVGRKE